MWVVLKDMWRTFLQATIRALRFAELRRALRGLMES
jgi:hypothetical protein